MKAVLQFNAGQRLRARLAEVALPRITVVGEQENERFLEELHDTDVLLHVLKPITATTVRAAPKLKLIQKIGVGVNTIDLDAAQEAGVAVANMPGTNTQAVAEHTLALMLAVLRRVGVLDAATRMARGWNVAPEVPESSGEIAGRTVGLVGFGAIPQRLAPVLKALGAEVIFYNRSPRSDAQARQVSLGELLSSADIVSLHLPATPETRHLIDAEALGRMKSGAILINTARGELVDEMSLAANLRSGHLAGAGLDVFEDEPVREPRPLMLCSTAVLTPHIAWLTPETITRSLAVIAENCRRLSGGEALLHEVVPVPAAMAATAHGGSDGDLPSAVPVPSASI
jgi:phosphoglycerate dehydrogenase-like enzyme